jgi:hypothetical protein
MLSQFVFFSKEFQKGDYQGVSTSLLKYVPNNERYLTCCVIICTCAIFVVFQNGDYQGVSTSRLKYVPNIEDDGRYLTCRVIIRGKAEKVLEDAWEIKVLCKYVYKKCCGTAPFLCRSHSL